MIASNRQLDKRSAARPLSQEERELWAHVTRFDEPLSPRAEPRPKAHKVSAISEPGAACNLFEADARGAAPSSFDPRRMRRLARGQRDIDARLDLHGLRQEEAYRALQRFLASCREKGHRHVLIITGKGRSEAAEELGFCAQQRGVLRRLVPHWLSEPAMRTHVVSFTESALRHGGSGALYVTIRKAGRRKNRAHR
ncbi:MAG TPA: Smr/MutS family protein [Hyphomicrobiales bacterium]|nr:Smr/MutS family protein [Hyphomicrobiales bacterium]